MRNIAEKDLVEAVSWGDGATRIFLTKIPPKTWTVATNASLLIGISEKVPGITIEDEGFPGLVSARTLISEPIIAEAMDRQEFIQRIDSTPRPKKQPCEKCKDAEKFACKECGGTGSVVVTCDECGHQHDCICFACRGEKVIQCSCANVKPVRVFELRGLLLDADCLIRALQLFDDEEIRVSTGSLRKEGPFVVQYITIEGGNWRIVLASRGTVEKKNADSNK